MTGRNFFKRVPALLALVSFFALADSDSVVAIADYRFVPETVTVRAGDSVRWVNQEKRTSHSVLFPSEGGLESDRLFPGESWRRRFTQAGRYDYSCGPHPEMKGTVIVTAAESDGLKPAEPTTSAEPAAARQRQLIHLVRQDCGSCHGMTLQGGLGPALTPAALHDKPAEGLVATIYGGRPGTPMPPWKQFLSEAEAGWIVDQLLRGFPQ